MQPGNARASAGRLQRSPVIVTLWLLTLLFATISSGCRPPAAAPSTALPSPTGSTLPTATRKPTATLVIIPTAAPTGTPAFESPLPTPTTASGSSIPVYGFSIVNVYPHDPQAFTQGLVYDGGVFYESTGLLGRSSLRLVEPATGKVLRIHSLPQSFGEGLSLVGGRLIQLTWKEHVALIYAKDSFEVLGTFAYPTEGWGLTYDGSRLIMSDGTAALTFRDPTSFEEIGRVIVMDDQGLVIHLNELEYVEGEILANIWLTDRIARIDPASGRVTGWIDLAGLPHPNDPAGNRKVLNGIAYDVEEDRLFVTGKEWPHLFEIEIVPPDRPSP